MLLLLAISSAQALHDEQQQQQQQQQQEHRRVIFDADDRLEAYEVDDAFPTLVAAREASAVFIPKRKMRHNADEGTYEIVPSGYEYDKNLGNWDEFCDGAARFADQIIPG